MSISSMDHLREKLLKTIDKLINNEITAQEAMAIGQLSSVVFTGLRTQMEYARLIDAIPSIPFLGDMREERLIENEESDSA